MGAELFGWWDAGVREVSLFAAVLFLIGGVDDLAIDVVYAVLHLTRRRRSPLLADLRAERNAERRYAIFVPAWDEAAVIGAMLDHLLAILDHPRFTVFVGTYPNDPATVEAVSDVAARNPRVRLVTGEIAGPTTKADCLNRLWRALCRARADGEHYDAVVLHDAEDVVHPGELRVFDSLLATCPVVQLPVRPLADPRSALIAGHYLDEFAESHGKTLVVRQALGAALPLAGVGCAIRTDTLVGLADARDGAPFDASCVTEDYELGLAVAAGCLAHVREWPGGRLVAVQALFPGSFDAAVRQKARWMTGIALTGWDRIGWRPERGFAEQWMRMRDRRAPIEAVVLLASYAALFGWVIGLALHAASGVPAAAPSPFLVGLLKVNMAILYWRLAVRAWFTGRGYGWREAVVSPVRMLVGNAVALAAASRAARSYWRTLRGESARWDKTAHTFPDLAGTTQ